MTVTEIREALTEVRDATPVPHVDRLSFERRVRAERRRRTTGRAMGRATAAMRAGHRRRAGAGPHRRRGRGRAGLALR